MYLKAPGLPQEDLTNALLARGAARRAAAERLMVKTHQGTKLLKPPSSKLIKLTKISGHCQGSTLLTDTSSLCFSSVNRFVPPRFATGLTSIVFSHTRGKNEHVIGLPWRYGTESLRTSQDITSEHGCPFQRSIAMSPNATFSLSSTFTSEKTKNIGTEPSTPSTESKKIQPFPTNQEAEVTLVTRGGRHLRSCGSRVEVYFARHCQTSPLREFRWIVSLEDQRAQPATPVTISH